MGSVLGCISDKVAGVTYVHMQVQTDFPVRCYDFIPQLSPAKVIRLIRDMVGLLYSVALRPSLGVLSHKPDSSCSGKLNIPMCQPAHLIQKKWS